ncbi:gluconolaconase [Novosphingobium mangrovi (ex Huang et al. 2023)]|uniref:Gluconolaconase n=1 Tax=Novosphingobium mangrovi (ex Huang et al. 2023) TaxID=2976432 RepID=A0ABT2I0H9_9SPHN|nr:gluconolaconase [Novosphingobium mangrovi (ex Huang et al. 2023)]MCT2398311.1 gluconolaconase [Novosphingobium mangrovi (ex Huang et al. 2023)]
MLKPAGRNRDTVAAKAAEGWTLDRATSSSRLNGANGLRTGADGRIYVAQVAGSKVSAIDVDTGAIETISPMGGGIVGPDDLAFDSAGNLYCTEITEGRVSMMTPKGEYKVIEGDMPVANPITCYQDRIIAGELRMGARIMELDKNGGAPRVIVKGLPMVNAFEVGPDGKLYFPAQGANEIWRVSLDGGEPEVVAKDLGVPDSVKFHPDGYIVSTQVYSGQVLKIDPRTGEKEVLADIGPGLDNVAFVGGRTFVSHITGSIHEITAPGVAKPLVDKGLQWPIGLAVGADGTLFVADGGFTYTLAPGGELQLAGMLFSPGFPGWVRDVTAAGAGEWVVTTANGDVARFRPAAQESEVLASGLDLPMGVDGLPGGGFAVAEFGTGKVLMVVDGRKEELASGLDRPVGVAVAGDGTVYVAESGAGRVVKLAGGRKKTVLDGLARPEGIAIVGGTLYVADPGAGEVVVSDLSGGAREVAARDLPIGAPGGAKPVQLGGVGDMCGPMNTFTGIAAASDGTVYLSADAEGSVLALRRA